MFLWVDLDRFLSLISRMTHCGLLRGSTSFHRTTMLGRYLSTVRLWTLRKHSTLHGLCAAQTYKYPYATWFREAMSTIWRTWTQRSGLYTNDNEVLTHLSRRFKLEVINRRWFDSSWIEQRVNRRWKNSTAFQVA